MVGRIGPVTPDQWSSVEVTTAVTGAGTLSLALVPAAGDANSAHFLSKEASVADAPYVRIQYEVVDGDGDGVPDGPDCDDSDANVHPGATELCNGLDDDCDGEVDETCPCTENDTRPCGTDQGECVAGLETCSAWAWGACVGATGPVTEVCGDGLDNDCDGVVDNGCSGADAGPDDPPDDSIMTSCSSCSAGDANAPFVLVPLLVLFGMLALLRVRRSKRR
jgi:hypothetical protein